MRPGASTGKKCGVDIGGERGPRAVITGVFGGGAPSVVQGLSDRSERQGQSP